MLKTRFLSGFTLVELMIVLAIASVLATLIYPSYRDHLIRGEIPEATGGLSLYATRLEEYYLDHLTYEISAGKCGPAIPDTGRFRFDCIPSNSGQAYLLTATGVAGDLAEFSFTLDQHGNERTTSLPSSWGSAPANCWIQRRQASC